MVRRIGMLLFAVCTGMLAQTSAPASGSSPSFRVTTRLVFVDVLVRDPGGKVVAGLGQNDFRVFEDGKPQSIEFFTAHGSPSAAPGTAPAMPPTGPGGAFSNTGAAATAARPLTILLFDLMNTPTDDQLFARKQMLQFLFSLPSGEHMILASLTSGLSMAQGVSGSRTLLSAASEMLHIRNVGLDPSRTETQLDDQIAANAQAQFEGAAPTAAVHANAAEAAVNYEVRARSTIQALGQLARILANYPGRKSLYWVAENYPLSIDRIGVPQGPAAADLETLGSPTSAAGTHGNQSITGLETHFSQTSLGEMRTTLNLLATARVAVYPTSVIGLASQASSVAVMGGVETAVPNSGDPRGGFFVLNNLRSDMNDLARVTGGEAIFGTNDLAGAMLHTLNDASVYYTLAYKPADNDWNGQFRAIQIDAPRGDSLIYRRGYFATPDASATDQGDDLARAMQPGAPEETSLRLRSGILPPLPGVLDTTFQSTIDTRDVDFSSTPDGHRHATLRVQMIAFSDAAKQPQSMPQTSGFLHIDLDPDRFRSILAEGIAFRQSLALKPGRYVVLLGVSEQGGEKLGTLEMPVSIP